mmetsp:Transcript_55356/g.120670  ORF Transcript_55356/g.120670 Transcript_55356/m.120670 type:complete len:346 (+) Transcript_55356:1087-2124(+)
MLKERVQDVALRLHELVEGLLVVSDVHEEQLAERVVVHGPVLPVLKAMAQEAELWGGVVAQDVLDHVVLEQEPAGHDQVRGPVRGVHNVDASGELVEEGEGFLDHRLQAVPLLQVVPYLVDQQPQDGVLVLETKNRREPLADLLLHHLLGVLPDVDLAELLQKVEVGQLQPLRGGALLVREVDEAEDPPSQLPVHHVRRRALGVGAAGLRRGVAAHQCPHHVDDPRHLLLEDGLRHLAGLAQARDLLEVLHDVLGRVLVPAAAQVGEHLQLLSAEHLVLQRVVPVQGVLDRGLRHEEPGLDVRDRDLLDVRLQRLRGRGAGASVRILRLVLHQDHGTHHRRPEAE